ncbi:G-type lectin S-receptor-like serine/threonine-protein kinase [Prunus yedoensis var. nudiflora]|uniref:G-type lectin S-receptor-like serine/threonine-protein kinase n=1 Tax=Prunus yedoensis var. nudiflora TaxID=2094558 RepID=A0A314YAF3_PRUYE|nr:G-type lectin S-receptor-like serine/threonine-protein kinase [Prunus yedoensis var. nudiflora]
MLLDSGNFAVKVNIEAADQLWESFDYPSDTLLPSMLLGFDSKSGKRNVLTAWKSESDPSTGMFLAGLTPQVPSQVPAMDDGNLSGFYLDDNVKQGTKYFSYNFLDKTVAYIDITSEGILKLMYSVNGENWNLSWVAQENSCDKYGACGPLGFVKASESPTSIRECLKGFVPKSDEEWSEGNRTGGCVWQTKLSCESNTNKSVTLRGKGDGFSKMVGLKVPDFHEYIMSSDAEECKIQCLNNCSCLAYAYVNAEFSFLSHAVCITNSFCQMKEIE